MANSLRVSHKCRSLEIDEIVQVVPSNGPDQSFTGGICRCGLNRCSSHNRFRFVPNERGPALIGASVWRFLSKYFLTVRGEMRVPSLSFSSSAIRSSPQVGLPVRHLPNQFAPVSLVVAVGLASETSISKRPERGAMPFKECFRFDNDQTISQSKNLESKAMRAGVAAV